MSHPVSQTSPIAFPVSIARLPQKGMPVTIEASETQRAALASVHGLRDLATLRAELLVRPWKRDGVSVEGNVRAELVQDCIVTLEPVHEIVDEPISALFVPAGSRLAVPRHSAEGEVILDAEGDDAPEVFSGDTIDVGQLAEEYFAMGINPYPRKAGAALDASGADDKKRGPLFEKLSGLAKKL